MIAPIPERRADFLNFAERQVLSRDYDPFHAALYELSERGGLVPEKRAWLCLLYMAYYSMGSAWAVFQATTPGRLPSAWADDLHIGQQRRNLRATSVRKHLRDLIRRAEVDGSLTAYLCRGFRGQPRRDWTALLDNLGAVWGNGRWASYTTAELLEKVVDLPVEASTVGLEGATGPRQGVCVICGVHPDFAATDELAQTADALLSDLQDRVGTGHLPWADRVGEAMLESCLCDYYGLWRGNYYVGRDIDRMQQRIHKNPDYSRAPELWDARRSAFAECYLGEVQGWDGIRKDRLTKYKTDHVIVDDAPDRARIDRRSCVGEDHDLSEAH